MKNSVLLLIFILTTIVTAQENNFTLDLEIYDAGEGYNKLAFGIAGNASDSLDTEFGESELPPFPPSGVFEARFLLPQNGFSGELSSYTDIREAGEEYTGEIEYRIALQKGAKDSLFIGWELPAGISGRIADIITGTIVRSEMDGSGTLLVEDPVTIDELRMVIDYTEVTGLVTSRNDDIPRDYSLSQNYPNPFNPSTKIDFYLPEQADIKLTVYDITGRELITLMEGKLGKGNHTALFDAEGRPSGVYFVNLKAGGKLLTRKMTLIK